MTGQQPEQQGTDDPVAAELLPRLLARLIDGLILCSSLLWSSFRSLSLQPSAGVLVWDLPSAVSARADS